VGFGLDGFAMNELQLGGWMSIVKELLLSIQDLLNGLFCLDGF
jgi:hypothetical protein